MSTYDLDFHAWTREQAAAVRSRSANELDWDNVAEELEDLGKEVVNALYSRYEVLLVHLLKWMLQPERRGRSWSGTIKEQRLKIARLMRKNPSLKAEDGEAFAEAYEVARVRAARETRLPESRFPLQPPFTPEEARDPDWWAGTAPPD